MIHRIKLMKRTTCNSESSKIAFFHLNAIDDLLTTATTVNYCAQEL